ncbi:MAG TPA: MFS transporter, partial [Steroidobacteraceae bacterium]|nr:MFS transporter [Steroidobacteraceae bacterium]
PPVRVPLARTAGYALTLVALTNAMSLLDRNILAILAPRIKHDIGVGDAEMGLLYGTVFALFYALFSLPLGRLADGWVRTRLLGLALAFWSVATALAAAAHGFALLALSRLGVGIGEGAAQPAGFSLVFDHYAKPRRGFATAVIAAAIALGLGGSSVLGGVTADWWDHLYAGRAAPLGLRGWQFAFLVAAAPGLILAALLWRLPEPQRGRLDGIESPADPHPFRASLALLGAVTPGANWFALVLRRAGTRYWSVNLLATIAVIAGAVLLTRVTSAFSPRPPLHFGALTVSPHALQWAVVGFGALVVVNLLQRLRLADRPTFEVITRSPALLLCMGIAALQMMINYGTMGFTPSFLMKHYGLTPAATGLQFGVLAGVLGIIGPLISGPLSDRINARFPGAGRAYVTLVSLGVSPLIAIWVYHAPDPGSFYARFVLYSLVLTAWYPPLYALMFEQVLPRMRGITASLYIIVYTLFGIGIGPFVVGMIADANGGDLASAILAINWVAPAIVVMLIALARRVNRDEAGLLERARRGGEVLAAPAAPTA